MSLFYADYPIFGLCCTKNEIVLSGGGGGKDYGIEDQIEFYELENNKIDYTNFGINNKVSVDNSLVLKYVNSTTKQNGVIDSMCYNSKLNILVGGIKNTCLLFYIEESNDEKYLRMYLQFQTVWSDQKKGGGKQNICRFSRDGNLLLTGGTDNVIRLWELNRGAKHTTDIFPVNMIDFLGHEDEILDLDMSHDNLFTISTNRSGNILVHDSTTRQLLKKFSVPSKNGNFIARQCRFIDSDIKSPKRQNNESKNKQYLVCLLIHEIRGNSYVTTWNMKLSSGDTNNLENKIIFSQINSVFVCDKPSSILITSNDFKYIGVGTNSGCVKVYVNNINNLRLLKEGNFHDLPVTGLYFFKENKYIISSGADYTISVMDINMRKENNDIRRKEKDNSKFGALRIFSKLFKILILLLIVLLILKICIEHYTNIVNSNSHSNNIKNHYSGRLEEL
ncbi:hypothetical protein FG379_003573 [Cryptosporidium bovis]|uniref:uncharacterized protein n=1 Tax=Cryptosporidium bovis TaxID=310047 RepID=UPI00351A657D|nr:hypothetical protein FG379_003573 [Cryptosporidium bovis]